MATYFYLIYVTLNLKATQLRDNWILNFPLECTKAENQGFTSDAIKKRKFCMHLHLLKVAGGPLKITVRFQFLNEQ